jgi:hypothetical protein
VFCFFFGFDRPVVGLRAARFELKVQYRIRACIAVLVCLGINRSDSCEMEPPTGTR